MLWRPSTASPFIDIVDQCNKYCTAVNSDLSKCKARVFVCPKQCQPSPIFAGQTRGLPAQFGTFRNSTLCHFYLPWSSGRIRTLELWIVSRELYHCALDDYLNDELFVYFHLLSTNSVKIRH
jgi:hypothetical protein